MRFPEARVSYEVLVFFFFFQAEDGIRDLTVTGVQTCALPISFTGHRTDRRVSYAPAGGAQPKSSAAITQFTNCIVTAVWSDGVNWTPPVLFKIGRASCRERV